MQTGRRCLTIVRRPVGVEIRNNTAGAWRDGVVGEQHPVVPVAWHGEEDLIWSDRPRINCPASDSVLTDARIDRRSGDQTSELRDRAVVHQGGFSI